MRFAEVLQPSVAIVDDLLPDGDGVTTSNNDLLRFETVRRPIYPLDQLDS